MHLWHSWVTRKGTFVIGFARAQNLDYVFVLGKKQIDLALTIDVLNFLALSVYLQGNLSFCGRIYGQKDVSIGT